MYNAYSFNKKQNVLTDEERTNKTNSILKKDSGMAPWAHSITTGVLDDSKKALASGDAESIFKADDALVRWDNDLTQLGEMPKDRRDGKYMPKLVTDMYPRIKVNSPVNLKPLSANEPEYKNADQDAADYVSRVLGKKSNSAASNFKYTGTTGKSPLLRKSVEEIEEYQEFEPGYNKVENLKQTVSNFNNDESENDVVLYSAKRGNANRRESYETLPKDDFSATYGTSINRKDNFKGKGSQLGEDTKESRKKASEMIVEYKDTIIEVAKRYGVNPGILATCIFTEQACNIGALENGIDAIKGNFKSDTSVGIAQVAISTAMRMEEYMEEKIKPVKYFFGEIAKWEIPGMGTVFGTKETAVKKRATDPIGSIEYAAAYIAYMQDVWKKEYPRIDGDTAILATVYNNGKEAAHSTPGANDFGRYARANYYYIRSLLGLSLE